MHKDLVPVRLRGNLDSIELSFLAPNDRIGKWRVLQVGGVALSVVQHPMKKVPYRGRLGAVGLLLID
jgi:hypothetical protein